MFLGEAIHNKFEDVASAATTDVSTAEGVNVNITGTTGITSFGSGRDGLHSLMRFASAVTITHSANIQCPGDRDITTAAGDFMLIVSRGGGVWEVVGYWPADDNRMFAAVHLQDGSHGGPGYGFSNQFILESNGPAGVNIRTPDANAGELNWSSPTDSRGATIGWSYNSAEFVLGARSPNHDTVIKAGNWTTVCTFDGTNYSATFAGDVDVASGKVYKVNGTQVVGAQQTTGVAEAAFTENAGGTAVNVDSTFGGYTLQQIAQALQNHGLLA